MSKIVLAPTARLSRNLARELAADKINNGETAWLRPAIFSFSAWTSHIRDQHFLSAEHDRVPISTYQSLVIWQSIIDTDVFVGEPRVAGLAQRSWRLVHEYDLRTPDKWPNVLLSEDSLHFKQWSHAYLAACREQGLVDEWAFAAEIPQLVAKGSIELPEAIELVGFDLPETPLQIKILNAFKAAGTDIIRRGSPSEKPSSLEISQFDEPDDELFGAAHWARALLEANPNQSIAIVMPDLGGRVNRADRLFREAFDPPGFTLQESGNEAWHISLGKPLIDWPLVTDTLAILSQSHHRLSQPEAMRLLRSPFLTDWNIEHRARNQTLTGLALNAPYYLTINELRSELKDSGASSLAKRLMAWHTLRRGATKPAWPSEWTRRFQMELSGLGFGTGRKLNSREYQILQRWHELLEDFSTLDMVSRKPCSRSEALAILKERAREAIFREQDSGVPVEILGVQEALGSKFDALWITTLDNNTWPGAPGRDPLIPAAFQSAIPRTTSDSCLEQARNELDGLLASAPITRGSFVRGNDETARQLTAILPDCPVHSANSRPAPAIAEMETSLLDDHAPSLDVTRLKGGTGILTDQSKCPFRAFARQRLNAADLTPPRPGLDARQRGQVIHTALENFWSGFTGSADLVEMDPDEREQQIQAAVNAALDKLTGKFRLTLTPVGRQLEQRRIQRLLGRWLDVERQRGNFSVIAHEQKIPLSFAGLRLTGKIDRLDRLADGTTMLIDYKTGGSGKSDWFPEPRIRDPQLPAYAVSMDTAPSAIAFARLRADELKFDGLSEGDTGTSGVSELTNAGHKFKQLESWSDLLDDWKTYLEALAVDFVNGKAPVDPSRPAVCNTCHLPTLCRIHQRAPNGTTAGENGDE